MSRGNWALVYSDGTIIIIRAMLEETMPMLVLLDIISEGFKASRKGNHDAGAQYHIRIC